MNIQQYNLMILGAMARGNAEYNADAAALAAKNVLTALTIQQPGAWPPGSDSFSIEGTRANASIWENFPDVMAKQTAAVEAATAMANAAGTDLEALRAAMGPLGQACTACHKEYRDPE